MNNSSSSGSGSGMNSQRGTLAAQGANSFAQNLSAAGLPSLQSFMTPTVKNLALGIIVPALLAKIRLRWVAFGVLAYYGLRLLNQKGVLPQQAHEAFDSIDRGIDAAKEKIGFSKSTSSSSIH